VFAEAAQEGQSILDYKMILVDCERLMGYHCQLLQVLS
jgi:hypothetical protein